MFPKTYPEIIGESKFPGLTVEMQGMDGEWTRLAPPITSSAAKTVAKINAETERWCATAAAMGDGYRVFRSEPQYRSGPEGYFCDVGFSIIAPGTGVPGSGVVFGPWPSGTVDAALNEGDGE